MRRLITKSLEFLSYAGMLVIVLAAAIGGAGAGGFLGLIGGLLGGVILSVIGFGALFVLMDTADNTRKMVELLERKPGSQ